MSICNIFKAMMWVNRCRKPLLVVAIVAMVTGIFVGKRQQIYAAAPKEPSKVSAPTSNEIAELSKQIKDLVKGLEYSDKVAQDFVKIVSGWEDEQGRSVLAVWKQRLNQARQNYQQGKISKAQLAKVEESIAKELSQRIRKEIGPDLSGKKFFDLADVVKHRQAQCLGYSQIFYLLGDSVGLSVKTIIAVELMTGLLSTSHVACIIGLADSKVIIIDLSIFPNLLISKAFELNKEFTKIGNYWELKDKDNALGIHRRIQTLDRNGLIASIYNNRGGTYNSLGQPTEAISHFNKAIEFSPKLAQVYNNRGLAYNNLGQHTQAIYDFNKAIELNPNDAAAYNNRGYAYGKLGQHTKAISEYTIAIELNPKLAEAYSNRASAYGRLGQYTKAISDCNKAIELNPKYDGAYNNRGVAYAFLGKFEEAKKDLLKAVELNPASKAKVKKISDMFKLNLKLD